MGVHTEMRWDVFVRPRPCAGSPRRGHWGEGEGVGSLVVTSAPTAYKSHTNILNTKTHTPWLKPVSQDTLNSK